MSSIDLAKKEKIFDDLANLIKTLSRNELEYGEGIITAHTLKDSAGNELLELQTDYDDHLDLLVIVNGKPYSLGGAYVHGLVGWEEFYEEAKKCIQLIFDEGIATEEEWLRADKRVGGDLYIPSKREGAVKLHDRTGSRFGLFTRVRAADRVLIR